ncbi:choice-of-anchor M domain-containing protein [Kribbella sp. NPDC023855]|uniref:choice-of-anchor M domain-containing protein n=1 Tax=Kribbella sp. NPDC023855 TaxID=3154698 RepID=UPI0033D7F768
MTAAHQRFSPALPTSSPPDSTRRRSVLRSSAAAGFALALALAVAFLPLRSYAEAPPEVLQAVHTDVLHTTYDGTALRLNTRIGLGDYREADPAGLIFNLEDKASARVELPDLPAFAFLGKPGDSVWIAPEAQDPELIWPGWDTETIAPGVLADDAVDLTLVSATGPGNVEVFFNYSEFTGVAQRVFSSADPTLRVYRQQVGSHVHANWSFSQLGTYTLTFQATATTTTGTPLSSGPINYTFVVGPYTPPTTTPPTSTPPATPPTSTPPTTPPVTPPTGTTPPTTPPPTTPPTTPPPPTTPTPPPTSPTTPPGPTPTTPPTPTTTPSPTPTPTHPPTSPTAPSGGQSDDNSSDTPPNTNPTSTPSGNLPPCITTPPPAPTTTAPSGTTSTSTPNQPGGTTSSPGGTTSPGTTPSTTTPPNPPGTDPTRVTLSNGHADYAVRLEAGKLTSRVKDGTKPGTPVWRDPSKVTIRLTAAAATRAPGGAFAFLGPEGSPLWQIPQTQKAGVIWLGWNTEELTPGQLTAGVEWRLDRVTGPGNFAVFEFDSFGRPKIIFNSGDGLPDTYRIPLGTHAHGNWSFTKPGTYQATFTHTATLTTGATSTTTSTLTFVVTTTSNAPGGAAYPAVASGATSTGGAGAGRGAAYAAVDASARSAGSAVRAPAAVAFGGGGAQSARMPAADAGAQGARMVSTAAGAEGVVAGGGPRPGVDCRLASTGGEIGAGWVAGGTALVLIGVVVLVATRRRSDA